MNLVMVLCMLAFVSLSISVCMLVCVYVSNALLMSNATVMVRFWLKPVAIVLLMQCSAVSVECLL